MNLLPAGWRSARLGDVCVIASGATPKTGVASYWGGDVPWITPADMSRDRSKVLTEGARSLTHEGLDSCSATLVPKGSVVFSSRAPIGYVAIAGTDLATNQGCKSATPPRYIDSNYLYYYLQHVTPEIRSRASGTTFQEISGKKFAETTLVWPSIDEQRRIVAILEDHLSRLDAASASLRKTEVLIENAMSSVREQAIVGELQSLGSVAEVVGGIQKQPKRAPKSNPAPFLRVANVTSEGLDLTEVHEVELFAGELDRYRLLAGDLLVVEGNGSASQIGRAATWHGEIRDCVHQNHLIRVRPGAGMNPGYLEIVWNAPSIRRRLSAIASSTSGLHTLSVAKLKALAVPVPDSRAQAEHVVRYDEVRTQMNRADAVVAASLKRTASLRRSLLQAAFSGQLTKESSLV